MTGNGTARLEHIAALTYQRALDLARQTEGELDPDLRKYLEQALQTIWQNIKHRPDSYILTSDEFAVFNFYQDRFRCDELAERAIARYWHVALRQNPT